MMIVVVSLSTIWTVPLNRSSLVEVFFWSSALAMAARDMRRNTLAYQTIQRCLRIALRLDRTDIYANNFLATIYFLEGNLEAALKYWNRAGKPRIEEVRTSPNLHV